jgi:hypothetical protein
MANGYGSRSSLEADFRFGHPVAVCVCAGPELDTMASAGAMGFMCPLRSLCSLLLEDRVYDISACSVRT